MVTTIGDREYKDSVDEDKKSGPPRLAMTVGEPFAESNQERLLILDELGQGAGGAVYAVYDQLIKREVALKIVHQDRSDSRGIERFVQEARITASLEHPNIMPVYEINATQDKRVFFTMRRSSGVSLDAILFDAEQGSMPDAIKKYEDRVEIILKVCDAISFAHEHEIIHQDIKPGNIMLGDFGEVLVVDWGTAHRLSDGPRKASLMGTPAYMSPEQARKEAADQRSDIYCIGATLFHLLTLKMPTTGTSTEIFWERKRAGIIDDLPFNVESQVPSHLLEVARRAMTSHPDDRFQSPQDLRQALVEWSRHRESLYMCDDADLDWSQRGVIEDYAIFSHIQDRYKNAIIIWPENLQAQDSLQTLELEYARCALRRGDLDLAQSLLPVNPPAEVQGELQHCQRERLRSGLRKRRIRQLGAALVLAILGFFAVTLFAYLEQFGAWQSVYIVDFQDSSSTSTRSDIEWVRGDFTNSVTAPEPTEAGVGLGSREMLWFPALKLRGDVRITAIVSWPQKVDGLEFFLQTKREDPPVNSQVPSGFSCQFASYRGLFCYISKNKIPGPPNEGGNIQYDFTTNTSYALMFERRGSILTLSVDGREILRDHFVMPVAGPEHVEVGIRSWSNVIIQSIQIERLSFARKSSPLIAPDALYATGNKQAALLGYQSLAEDYLNTDIAEGALSRACLLSFEIHQPLEAISYAKKLLHAYPESEFVSQCLQEWALYVWEQGDALEALQIAEKTLKIEGESRVVLEMLRKRPHKLDADIRDQLISLLRYSDYIPMLNIDNLGLQSLEALRGIHIASLSIDKNDISDLSPLMESRVISLSAEYNKISDLSPLIRMDRCRHLNLKGNEIVDISPLRGLPLQELTLDNNRVVDLAPLFDKDFETLSLAGNFCENIDVLSLSKIKTLRLSGCPLVDLAPLKKTQVENLWIAGTLIRDLNDLRGLPLRRLDISGCDVTDLSPLSAMPLRWLSISHTQVSDLSPLRTVPLENLWIRQTQVTDLSPLEDSHIWRLSIRNTQITEISEKLIKKLGSLEVYNSPIQDWSCLLEGNKLISLLVRSDALLYDDFLPLIEKWGASGRQQYAAQQLKTALAFQEKDWDGLKNMGRQFAGRRYTLLPQRCTYDQAMDVLATIGCQMPMLDQKQDLSTFLRATPTPRILLRSYWIGAILKEGEWYWANGKHIPRDQIIYPGNTIVNPALIWHEYVGGETSITIGKKEDLMHLMLMWEDD